MRTAREPHPFERGGVQGSNCSPSYRVHCIATTTPNGGSQPVDLIKQWKEMFTDFQFGEQL